jgi:hypothetical protein
MKAPFTPTNEGYCDLCEEASSNFKERMVKIDEIDFYHPLFKIGACLLTEVKKLNGGVVDCFHVRELVVAQQPATIIHAAANCGQSHPLAIVNFVLANQLNQ